MIEHGKVKTGSPYKVAGVWYYPLETGENYNRTGVASWYGAKFHGKKTANGERYDMHAMTAAHTTLPMPSRVRVTNLDNGRSIIVRVNDRGPFVKDRIIDLSRAAAEALGYLQQGTARVRVQTLDAKGIASAAPAQPHRRERLLNGDIYIQMAAFKSLKSAKELRWRLVHDYPSADISYTPNDALYRVRIGPLSSEQESQNIKTTLQRQGYANPMIVVQ